MGLAEDLASLGDLFERGVINRTQFEEAKQKLLADPAGVTPEAASEVAPSGRPQSTHQAPTTIDPDHPSSRGRRLLVMGGAIGLAVVAIAVAVSITIGQGDGDAQENGDAPEAATPTASDAVRAAEVDCPEVQADLPTGTRLTSLVMEHLDDGSLRATAVFDDLLPDVRSPAQRGDLSVSVTFVFNQAGVAPPYSVMVSTLFGSWSAQAGRPGGGFIDSGGIRTTVYQDAVQITFDPAPFVELDAGARIDLSATTLVSEFIEEPQRLGFAELGEQSCGEGS